MRARILLAGAAIAAGAMLAGGVLLPSAADPSTADENVAGGSLRDRIAMRPEDAALRAQLGASLLQRARDEAAPAFLVEAETALRASLELQPDGNVPAFVGMAALANARHQFSESVEWSRRAIAANPYNASAHGLLGDALFELGHVRAAAGAYQDMVDLRPDTASYIRASYTLQYEGATRAAIRAMKRALQAAGPTGKTAAFVHHQLGDIYAGQHRYAASERANRRGIAAAPGFIPPTVGVAESYLARNRPLDAIPLLEHAVAKLPALEYLITLSDAYAGVGRAADAAAMYERAAQALTVYRRSGVEPDADFILFYADHGLRPRAALREAFAIYDDRPTGKVADALAWMLHAVGRDAAARPYARQAIRAVDADAATFAHAAQIERALGHRNAAARLERAALRLDPGFPIDAAPDTTQLEEVR